MELVKNIFFNTDKIVENTEIKITYAGALFQNGSNEVIIHLGFGDDWNNAQDIAMNKTELGFQANVNVIEATKLNFCFKQNISYSTVLKSLHKIGFFIFLNYRMEIYRDNI